jgi:hypothetical protein
VSLLLEGLLWALLGIHYAALAWALTYLAKSLVSYRRWIRKVAPTKGPKQ